MIITWTRQSIIATGLFAILLTVFTTKHLIEEERMVKSQLKDAKFFHASNAGKFDTTKS